MSAVASSVASCARASAARVPSRRGGYAARAGVGAKSARGASVVPAAFTPAGAKIAGVGMELP